ncbi:MAG: terpene cyclase/mutase family protein [Verrucomicrobia bacterium]|nr:terpene cyclase/mutase family protein [Verrucomicrobiota bacterium]
MLQVARLAPKLLGESASLVADFVKSRLTDAGGFADRDGRPDLYYTVFGLEAMLALQLEPGAGNVAEYLVKSAKAESLDFVHACSLARCGAALQRNFFVDEARDALVRRIQAFQTPDGGFHGAPERTHGSAYGALLAWGALSDLDASLLEPQQLLGSLRMLQLADGSFANERGLEQGSTSATAAALILFRHLQEPPPVQSGTWLLEQQHVSGGFLATPKAPLPDLLSTAVALHALDGLEILSQMDRERCLDFVDSLWSAEGGFHGHWADDALDVEYTYYGLLALGHLVM